MNNSTSTQRHDILTLGREDYDKALSMLCEYLAVTKGIRLVTTFGDVHLPGISDLDVLIICDDDCYARVVEASQEARQQIAHGTYFFPHQIFVLPASLAPCRTTLWFDHVFSSFRTLMGDSTWLDSAKPSPELFAITTCIWHTTLWRIIAELSDVQGERERLLLMQTFSRHIALDFCICGSSTATVFRTTAILRKILRLPFGMHLLPALFQQRMHAWKKSQNCLSDWWHSCVSSEEILNNRIQLPNNSIITFGKHISLTPGNIQIPLLYEQLCIRLRSTFSPSLEKIQGDTHSLPAHWEESLQHYCASARTAQKWGEIYGNPAQLFIHNGAGIFPSPFNLYTKSL